MIPLRQLKIFEKVASTNHVTKAFEELFLTQSAVNMAIAELERFAEAPPFHKERGKDVQGILDIKLLPNSINSQKIVEMLEYRDVYFQLFAR
ncbi:MAG: LysR family transcriptional regulator [Desulfuromonadales bacterium]|nr:LysR family transcriptional regulator [Desulfuromonadales bacterium]